MKQDEYNCKMKDINNYTNKLIAHRGYFDTSKNIPENSLIAFKRAIIFDYHIELDIRMLKDKNIIVFHDSNLKRCCNVNKDVDKSTYDEIKELKLFNTNHKIPLLAEVLNLNLENTIIFIDIKKGIDKKVLMNILKEYKHKYVIISFFKKDIIWFKNKLDIKTGLISLNPKFNNYLKNRIHKPDFLLCNIKLINENTIEKYKKHITLIGWTVKNKKTYQKCKEYYDNLICENMNNF